MRKLAILRLIDLSKNLQSFALLNYDTIVNNRSFGFIPLPINQIDKKWIEIDLDMV